MAPVTPTVSTCSSVARSESTSGSRRPFSGRYGILEGLVWQKLMVVGLVEPYDGFDLRRLDPKNPPPAPWTIQPANPELLEALAEDFRTHNYSIHRVIRTIMKSNAYQLSTAFPGEFKNVYIPYYARRFARVLTP